MSYRMCFVLAIATVAAIAVTGVAMSSGHESEPGTLIKDIRSGNCQRVVEILDRGVSPNAIVTDFSIETLLLAGRIVRFTPLIEAVRHDHSEIVAVLIRYGADPNMTPDREAYPALFFAIRKNNAVAAALLLEAGASIRTRTPPTDRPIYLWALERGRFKLLVMLSSKIDPRTDRRLLVEAVEHRNARVGHSDTPSNVFYNEYLLELIRQSDANPDDHFARILSGEDIDLDRAGLDFNNAHESRWTSLTWAIVNGKAAIVRQLLDAGVDVNASTEWGATPLMAASQVGDITTIERLRSMGADASMKDHLGMTAIDYAESELEKEAVEYLRSLEK
ncbi:MAG: ankyrin repeat domain-containing protein [Phycisphaerales bacterium]|nr:ankyrin repeat domain-containing protein [Phycisphaerales bacterium]